MPPARQPLRGHAGRRQPHGGTIGGRPPLERLQACAAAATTDDLELLQHGLFVGLVVDEHRPEFGRGDFLVRGVLGADPDDGALVVGDHVEVGQTVQFHVRDAAAADEDLRALLAGTGRATPAVAALLFTCNGRGRAFFGVPDHDAALLDRLLGPLPSAGAFCAASSARSGDGTSCTPTARASRSSPEHLAREEDVGRLAAP